VSNGVAVDFDATWRFRSDERTRVEAGLGGTFVSTSDANISGVSVPLRFVAGLNHRSEFEVALTPSISRLSFDSEFFIPVNVFALRLHAGVGWALGTHFQIGLSPIAVGILGSSDVDITFTYEPKLWMRVAML
jgi:hypothetical protein